jgi:hypothetical protein
LLAATLTPQPYPHAVFELGYFKRNPRPFFMLAKVRAGGSGMRRRHLPGPLPRVRAAIGAAAALSTACTATDMI